MSSSLISQLPVAAIRFPSKDIEASRRFYRDSVGLKAIEEEEEKKSKSVHFDLGNIRLTLTQASPTKGERVEAPPGQLIFVVENSLEEVHSDLAKRGVKFKSKKIGEDSSGKSISFADPDGNVIFLWQPPKRGSKNFKGVEAVVRHYELVSRAIADLRSED
jgi:catechol 2,3-dioxygenase-like lactoylglutathione lyase family enzyme